MVLSPKELNCPICSIASPVASLIEHGPGLATERIWYKALSGKLRTPKIATGDSDSADIYLPYHSSRYQVHLSINDINLGMSNWLSKGGCTRIASLYQRGSGTGRSFRWAIEIIDTLNCLLLIQPLC